MPRQGAPNWENDTAEWLYLTRGYAYAARQGRIHARYLVHGTREEIGRLQDALDAVSRESRWLFDFGFEPTDD
jgi:hypothetical protein